MDTAGSAIVLGHPQHVYEGDGPEIKHPFGVGIDKEKYPRGLKEFLGIMKSPTTILMEPEYCSTVRMQLWHFVEDLLIAHNIVKNIPYTDQCRLELVEL